MFHLENGGWHHCNLTKALESSEIKVNALQSELEGLQQTRDKVFQAPPIDWIEEKLTELSDVLEQNTAQSAEALRQVLGPIRMEATYPETGKPFYTAHTSISTLAIINKPTNSESFQKKFGYVALVGTVAIQANLLSVAVSDNYSRSE